MELNRAHGHYTQFNLELSSLGSRFKTVFKMSVILWL